MTDSETATDPERALVLSYAPRAGRDAMAALFALDDVLGQILRTTREPVVGQMRLTWWYEALVALDAGPPPAQPVLQAVSGAVLPNGITGARLAGMIDAWEVLLDGEAPDAAVLDSYAQRGVILFGACAVVTGASQGDPVAPAGRGWALADLARHVTDPDVAAWARALATGPIAAATAAKWSRPGRALGAMAHLARLDLAAPAGQPIRPATPARVWRLLRHRLTGR